MIVINTAEPEISLFFLGAYVTHNAIEQLSDITGGN